MNFNTHVNTNRTLFCEQKIATRDLHLAYQKTLNLDAIVLLRFRTLPLLAPSHFLALTSRENALPGKIIRTIILFSR
jgi:hypothetical protein